MALCARENSIEGMVLIHPGFWGSTVVGLESTDDKLRNLMKSFWSLVCPDSKGVDDPFLNPVGDGAPSLSGLACKRVLVCVAEMDFLKERGRIYYEKLRENIDWNGEVELCETQGEEHVFHLLKPNCENAFTLMNRLVSFFNVHLN
ncbi:Carboxylesterase protein [Dioscorea alata]|uniref:Carboxylesterase protein n=1 Tax=Dioscorea alata TaxID=55571 RepID=A0ACB7U561_DIOAL|nr:Carboxylesterase protein [Dioscorea alata]